jgi:hypothetical protein
VTTYADAGKTALDLVGVATLVSLGLLLVVALRDLALELRDRRRGGG